MVRRAGGKWPLSPNPLTDTLPSGLHTFKDRVIHASIWVNLTHLLAIFNLGHFLIVQPDSDPSDAGMFQRDSQPGFRRKLQRSADKVSVNINEISFLDIYTDN